MTNLSMRISFAFSALLCDVLRSPRRRTPGDGHDFNAYKMATCVLYRNSQNGWFYESPGLDRAVFDPHFAIWDPTLSWMIFQNIAVK